MVSALHKLTLLFAVVAAAVLLLPSTAAAMDFTAMAPATTRRLGDGHIEATHLLDREFTHPTSGRRTFARLNATVHYHEKWNFVQAADYAAATSGALKCVAASAAATTVAVVARSEKALVSLVTAARQDSAVLLAARLRCGGRGVFGHVVAVQADAATLTATIALRNGQLTDVFRHARVRFSTNHLASKAFTPEEVAQVMETPVAQQQHRMRAQHWFHHLTHAISHIAHDVAHDVSRGFDKVVDGVKHFASDIEDAVDEADKLLKEAEQTVEFIVKLALGNINEEKTWTLAKASFGNQALMDSFLTPVPTSNGFATDHYGSFDLTVTLELNIDMYRVKNVLAALNGDAQLALAASAFGSYSTTWSKQVADIMLPSINFAIGPIPVHIQPHIPIDVALGIAVGASAQFGMQAVGKVEYGFQYDGSKWNKIHQHSFTFSHRFSEPTAPHLSITASVTPSIALNIDFLGGPIAALRIVAACDLVNSDSLVITAQPTVILSAVFKLDVAGKTILGPQTIGPDVFDGTVYTLATIRIPNLDPSRKRFQPLQAITGSASSDDSASAAVPTVGAVFRGTHVDGAMTTAASFQIFDADESRVFLLGIVNSYTRNETGVIVVPYVMGVHPRTQKVYLRPNASAAFVTASSAEIPTAAPAFEDVELVQAGGANGGSMVLRLREQVGGAALGGADGTFVATNAVYTSTDAALRAASLNADAPSSGGRSDAPGSTSGARIAVFAGSAAAGVAVLALVALVVVRRSRNTARRTGGAPALTVSPTASEQGGDVQLVALNAEAMA